MAGNPRIRLAGFEDALAEFLAAQFEFSVQPGPLETGRNLFVQGLPEVEDLAQVHPGFDPLTDPQVALYTEQGTGVAFDGKHEWNLRIALRFGVVHEEAKELLEDLCTFLKTRLLGRRVGSFVVRGVTFNSRPSVFAREGDDHSYATASMRFVGVAAPV